MSGPQPERWCCDAGAADVALLDIPPVLHQDRLFEVDVRCEVRSPVAGEGWHRLTVELDGRRQWQRQVPSHSPGDTDSLDYHCRCHLPAGQALRIRASVQVQRSQRLRLVIEAESA